MGKAARKKGKSDENSWRSVILDGVKEVIWSHVKHIESDTHKIMVTRELIRRLNMAGISDGEVKKGYLSILTKKWFHSKSTKCALK
jgi:hypothetical protein